MKYDSVLEMIKEGEIVIPLYMYKALKKFNINLDSFIFLMYLRGRGDLVSFDIPKISRSLGIDMETIMNYVNDLQSQGLVEIKVIKNDNGILEEFISLEGLYSKLGLNVVSNVSEEITNKKSDTKDIFALLEERIGKQLSPMEIELVRAWRESSYSDEMIKEAINESVRNGVSDLRYIDKILDSWSSAGITSKEGLDKKKDNNSDKNDNRTQEKLELFDYDFMEDDE